MVTKEILKSNFKYLNGFLPINKPSGICCIKLLHSLKADLHFVLNQHDVTHGVFEIKYARYLEPFANGLVTFIFGHRNNKKRNFVFADYRYRAKVEFGVDREFNCIDGEILRIADINHLDKKTIESAIKTFSGPIMQIRGTSIKKQAMVKPHQGSMSSVEGIYDLIITPEHNSDRVKQKYPFIQPQREVVCKSIELVDYIKPTATLNISCQGAFNTRQLVSDLAGMLNTKASLLELTRLEEGPISLEDLRVLQLHDIHLENYIHIMPQIQNLYNRYLAKFDDLFETDSYRRHI